MRKMIRGFIAALIIVALMPCNHVNAASKLADSLNDKKIVHACGGFNGIRHANCEESLVEAIESGKKVIEIDFMFTSDDVLICVKDKYGESTTISTGFYGYYPNSESEQGWWSMWAYGCTKIKEATVIAWMPLPTPFESQESEDKE